MVLSALSRCLAEKIALEMMDSLFLFSHLEETYAQKETLAVAILTAKDLMCKITNEQLSNY